MSSLVSFLLFTEVLTTALAPMRKLPMIDPERSYKFSEQRPDRLFEVTFLPDKEIGYVKLPHSGLTWQHAGSPESRAACRQAFEAIQRSAKRSSDPAAYRLLELQPAGTRELASWTPAEEDPDLQSARESLETQGHAAYVIALAYLRQGDSEASDHAAAAKSYKDGVAILGKSYFDTKVLDDTGIKLVMARSMETKNGIATTAGIYRGILESRLSILAHRDKLTDAVTK